MTTASELLALADAFRTLNAPDQGMSYHGGHSGKRRFTIDTGTPYFTRSEPATLTVYGERARFLHDLIRRGPEIAELLDAARAAQMEASPPASPQSEKGL